MDASYKVKTKITVAASILAIYVLVSVNPLIAFIKKDEDVIFFPTSAYLNENEKTWVIPVHGWIFEREADSIWRRVVVEKLLKRLELDDQVLDDEIFRKRAWMFLVDNERGKSLQIRFGDRVFSLKRSKADGHFNDLLRMPRKSFSENPPNHWNNFQAIVHQDDKRRFIGEVQLLEPEGVSVISDIDDTIKVSNVEDKQELLANTFLRDFRAVPGMAAAYQQWARAGAAFHYVSSSPWQLFPALAEFTDKNRFPRGSYDLKRFRLKDQTFFDLFKSPAKSKPPVIESIIGLYPKRKFILVGDSGEKDPEIYATIAKRYPRAVMHIFIRCVSPQDADSGRLKAAFAGVPADKWTIFTDPRILQQFQLQ